MSEFRHSRSGSLNIQNSSNNKNNNTTMSPMAPAAHGRFDGPRSPPNTSHVPCKFFRQGACQAGTACPFSHDLGSAAETICKYFAKGNCKFGPKCANVHVLADGRRINYGKNGISIGHAVHGSGRGGPSAAPYNSSNSALTEGFMRADPAAPYNFGYPMSPGDKYQQLDRQPGMENGVPTIDTTYSHAGSQYGSPPEHDASRLGLGLSPLAAKGLSVLDAPLPASFDSNGISNAARFPAGPFPSSVPSQFGLESPSPSLNNAKDLRTSEALKLLHHSAFGSNEHMSAVLAASSPPTQTPEEYFGKRQMHSSRFAKPSLLSSSAPRPMRGIDRDWEAEFPFPPSRARLLLSAPTSTKVAALTLLSQTDAELSLQQHLDLAPDLLQYNRLAADVEPQDPLTMAAQTVPHPSTDRKRVKVYELRNNDWFDRGTGFCTAALHSINENQKEPRVIVESEDQPERILLETRICKEDGFHKQQETLIVWTEPSNGVDMALSFQEAEGCTLIWRFINSIQQHFGPGGGSGDDSLSDDLTMEMPNTVSLPEASLGNLPEIESQMRVLSTTAAGRDALTKFVLNENYIGKLIPLVEQAEDFESLNDLHRLCNIMKIIILLTDTSIIEHAVSDDCVMGVVGALEYDPDFPSHKANHRQWLIDDSRYKEVVRIDDQGILRKVHQTYRLQYLKDVVLARILDDNTFSVLNSLIFFNQVDIVQHIQANQQFLGDLFDIFKLQNQDPRRKKNAVLFIQQCCAVAKNLQPPARQTLYNNLLSHGLLQVINFGLRHNDVAVRVGATDILVSMIDHDPQMIRRTIYHQIQEKQPPLTDSLVDLLLIEVDLGVKSQISDTLKVLLDQGPPVQPEVFAKANGEHAVRLQPRMPTVDPQQEQFLDIFYEQSAVKMFQPLVSLKDRANVDLTVHQASMFTYLIEILGFFIRQHHTRSKFFVLNNDIVKRVAQLLECQEKFLKLVAIRFLRQLINLQDEFYIKHISEKNVLGPILDVLIGSMHRDNLLSSACLEFFEFIKKEAIKELIKHVVENYRDKLEKLDRFELFRDIILRYDQTRGFSVSLDYFMEAEEDASRKRPNVNPRTGGPLEYGHMDAAEEEYWNTSDDEDEMQSKTGAGGGGRGDSLNGMSSGSKLVDYGSDEDADDHVEAGALDAGDEGKPGPEKTGDDPKSGESSPVATPPERLSEKRRREEDEEEDLGKLIQHKRRNSSSAGSASSSGSGILRKKKNGAAPRDAGGGGPKKIAISLGGAVKAGGNGQAGGKPDDG